MSFCAHPEKWSSCASMSAVCALHQAGTPGGNAWRPGPTSARLLTRERNKCRAEAARTELDAAFTQHKREAAAAVQEARGQGTTVATRATRLESELGALRTSEAAALQRATAAEARSRELSLVRLC